MSVTLEQCALLRERHTLSQQHFSTALDWMRRCVFVSPEKHNNPLPLAFLYFCLFASFVFPVSPFCSPLTVNVAKLFQFNLFLSLFFYFMPSIPSLSLHISSFSAPPWLSFTLAHKHPCSSSRSRLSWGQMLGCYTQSGFPVSGLDPGETPSELPQCLAPKAPRRHLYPVAFLLVTSHLLVLWLILSLVILLAKYQ